MTDISLNIFRNIPCLETERLILKKITYRDLTDIYEYSQDENVTRYLLWDAHPNIKVTKKYLYLVNKFYSKSKFYDWGIHLKENNKMIGTCGFSQIDIENNSAEIGYVLNRKYWQRGFGAEAVSKVIEFGFDTMGFNRISARVIKGNINSLKVLSKNGLKEEGLLRGAVFAKNRYQDVFVYSIMREEYYNV